MAASFTQRIPLSSSVSGYSIVGAGNLSPLAGTVGASLPAGTTDLDVAVSSEGKFLYTLNSGSGTIGIFGINQDGTLAATGAASGVLPGAGFNGIAAF